MLDPLRSHLTVVHIERSAREHCILPSSLSILLDHTLFYRFLQHIHTFLHVRYPTSEMQVKLVISVALFSAIAFTQSHDLNIDTTKVLSSSQARPIASLTSNLIGIQSPR